MRALRIGMDKAPAAAAAGRPMRAVPIGCGEVEAGKASAIFRKAVRVGDPCACC